MTKDEALRLALEALDCIYSPLHVREITKVGSAMKAIKEALAQPEQEPVAMRYDFDGYGWSYIDNGSGSNWKEKIKNAEPLYTSPPQRKPLTDEQIFDLSEPFGAFQYGDAQGHKRLEFARAIEAAHGIKE